MFVALIAITGVDGLAEVLVHELGGDLLGQWVSRGDRPSDLAQDSSYLLGEGTYTTLSGVLLDDSLQSSWGEAQGILGEAVLLGLLGYEVLLGDA